MDPVAVPMAPAGDRLAPVVVQAEVALVVTSNMGAGEATAAPVEVWVAARVVARVVCSRDGIAIHEYITIIIESVITIITPAAAPTAAMVPAADRMAPVVVQAAAK